jgi:hypothetical protein
MNLLLKGGDHRYPLRKVEVLLLVSMLQVYDRVGALIHHLTSDV